MSYNPNFYNNFSGNNVTFHNFAIPPPPPPPAYFIPPPTNYNTTKHDQEFVKRFEHKNYTKPTKSSKHLSITEVRNEIQNMASVLTKLKNKEKLLSENIDNFSDDQWRLHIKEVEDNKKLIEEAMAQISGNCLEMLAKLLAKRTAKRLRLKRVNLERKRERDARKKEMEERSRKIDENLQKIKDDINKAKQEEESKLKADMVLKEVLRKKHDAKKYIVKLDALLRLHRARLNTAKGRGDNVTESETTAFNNDIDKLKSLWTQKLASYEKEETELRKQLTDTSLEQNIYQNETAGEVENNLQEWKEVLFGGMMPQIDFGHDIERFIAVRSHWDRYINSEGTSIPIGWVPPSNT